MIFINYFYKPDIFLLYIPIKRPFRIILLHIYRTPRARNFICRWKRRELLHFRQCLWFLWIDRLIFYWMFIFRRWWWWWCGDWLSIINWIHGCTHRIWVLITIICFCLVKKARLNLRRWNMFISSIQKCYTRYLLRRCYSFRQWLKILKWLNEQTAHV